VPGERFRLEDLEQVAEYSEQTWRRVEIVRGELERIVGVGESAGGRVVARADAGGRLIEVTLDPRAMELSSRDLGEEITLAVRRAQDDSERQSAEVVREGSGETMASPDEIMERFQDVAAAFNRAMDEREARVDDILRDIDRR
jgi:DNA-binding protein YbaB